MSQRNESAAVSEKSAPTGKGQSASPATKRCTKRTCKYCLALETLCRGLQDELRDSWREYRKLRDKLIENGIPVEDENGKSGSGPEGLGL